MSKLERITVTMPEEMAAKLRAAVEAGEYATTSEIVREALRDWSDYQERRAERIERFKRMLDEAEAGPSYPAEEVFAEIRQLVADKAAKYRAEHQQP
ncbi:type II toxin-antitoxin system ParD family antitoxin [Leptolyngbya sp. 15MV]|nr:type II toxin-antitoxin system ParD family antitoxin [Leptolyngbya sp. 15MV]